MRIIRDRSKRMLKLSKDYVKKILERFSLERAKPVGTPFASHYKLYTSKCPRTNEDREYMSKLPYAYAVGSLMYAMACIRLNIT